MTDLALWLFAVGMGVCMGWLARTAFPPGFRLWPIVRAASAKWKARG